MNCHSLTSAEGFAGFCRRVRELPRNIKRVLTLGLELHFCALSAPDDETEWEGQSDLGVVVLPAYAARLVPLGILPKTTVL